MDAVRGASPPAWLAALLRQLEPPELREVPELPDLPDVPDWTERIPSAEELGATIAWWSDLAIGRRILVERVALLQPVEKRELASLAPATAPAP